MTSVGAAPRRWRALVVPALTSAVMLAVLLGLGFWQVDRLAWKNGLLAAIAARAHGEPVGVPPERDWPGWRADADEFRRVRVSGVFEHGREAQVHGLAEERRGQPLQGVYVFTPLRLDDGSVVIVNRGIVPTALRRPGMRDGAQTAGRVTITGLMRAPETSRPFVPANDPARGEWFTRDTGQMARAGDLGRVAPFYIDADATPNPGGWPRGGQTQLALPNNHLGYAITWFGLAAALVGVFTLYAVRRLQACSSDPSERGRVEPSGPRSMA